MAKRRVGKYPLSFRQMAVERMKDCPSVSPLAKELGIDRSNMCQRQRQLEHASESSARVTSPVGDLRKQVRELKRVLAEKTLEVDFFKGAYKKSRLGSCIPGQAQDGKPEEPVEGTLHGGVRGGSLPASTRWI